jgi:hypothetical protein
MTNNVIPIETAAQGASKPEGSSRARWNITREQNALALADHLVAVLADARARWPDLTQSEFQ